MKKRKFGLVLSSVLAAGAILGACGRRTKNLKKKMTTLQKAKRQQKKHSQSQW